jgi:cell division protease FtsH
MKSSFFLGFALLNKCNGFHPSNKNIKMLEFNQDSNFIAKYKNVFIKDNYNHFIQQLNHKEITKIYINNDYTQFVSIDNNDKTDILYNHYHLIDANQILVKNVVDKASENNVPLYFIDFTPKQILDIQHLIGDLYGFISYSIPLFIFFTFFSMIFQMNRRNQLPSSMAPFGSMFQEKENNFIKPNISLNSWAGSPEVIEECKEVISYLEKKELYREIGAEMPKGILFEGPPGTGKTLLAKAIATETNSSFISISGSEFVELFVGMGASRVRKLFKEAREKRPSIIFIDEIDAVGRQRGGNANMANDEREQTLNQLLYEMDGFNNNEDIVVMAATNRKDVLDQALLRPGRFDRIIKIPLPDKDSREKILSFYLTNKKTDKLFNVSSIAELADGFSGAQLKNLINEAAILSVKNNHKIIKEQYIFDAFEKLIVGLIKTNATISNNVRERVAIHESGHSLLTMHFKEYFTFQKASIQPT